VHLAAILLTLFVHAPPAAPATPADASPASTSPHHGIEAILTVNVEQLPLGSAATNWSMQWEALARRLTLKPSAKTPDVDRFVKQLARHPSALCRNAVAEGTKLIITCESSLLQLSLRTQQNTRILEIREVRGLPWRGMVEEIVSKPFDPSTVGLGDACPGSTTLGKAECALSKGDRALAETLYRQSLKATGAPLAHVRLGELALRVGDTTAALSAFEEGAASDGPFGRLAKARVCELTGNCFDSHMDRIFDLRNVPDPLADEMTLRRARIEAFLGKPADGAKHLSERPDACRPSAIELCQRILLAALQTPTLDGDALPLFLSFSLRDEPPMRLQLAQAAAEASVRVGAPGFAATLLSAATPAASSAELPAHLLRVAQLYRLADDDVRASVVLEFAASRFGPALMKKPEWRRVSAHLPPVTAKSPAPSSLATVPEDDAAPDLARALLARTKAARFSDGAKQ
jgi:hypothetical protein